MRYQKIEVKIWNDEKFIKLTQDGKLLFLYLLTCPHSNAIGAFVLKKGYIVEDIGWQISRVTKTLSELLRNGFVTHDERVSLIIIKNFLKHNKIENPNQFQNAINLFYSLPESKALQELINPFETLSKHFKKPFETLSKPETETETEAETETETDYLQPSKTGLKLSTLLFEKIKSRNNGHKHPDLNAWAKDIDQMIIRDARDPTEIEQVICWCQEDSFWKTNILSTSKLRKQYDQLKIKMDSSEFDIKPRKDNLRAWLAEEQQSES